MYNVLQSSIDKAKALPPGWGMFVKNDDGGHCALGKLVAAILGCPLTEATEGQIMVVEENMMKAINQTIYHSIWDLNDSLVNIKTAMNPNGEWLKQKLHRHELATEAAFEIAIGTGLITVIDDIIKPEKEFANEVTKRNLVLA